MTSFLFGNAGPAEKLLLKAAIERVITNFEPRANIIQTDVEVVNSDIRVSLTFNVQNLADPINIDFFLNIIR